MGGKAFFGASETGYSDTAVTKNVNLILIAKFHILIAKLSISEI